MNLVKRNPEVGAWPMLLDNFFNRDAFKEGNLNFYDESTVLPAVNIKESNESFALELAAPGMSKTDFKVELNKNTLTISAEKSVQNDVSDEVSYSRKEFSYKSLRRSFTFPENLVDTEKIDAKYEDGILYLTLPKVEEARRNRTRQIEIS